MKQFFPFIEWSKQYRKKNLKNDFLAGATVGVLLIPQGMAYAMIAGLPPQYGLYAAIIPQIVYAFMGSSPVLAVGPVAMDSLLVATGLGAMGIIGLDNYIAVAIFLSLFMGCIQLLLGVLNLGMLVAFLSKPVISGFTSAAAIIIGISQIKNFSGIRIANEMTFLDKFFGLFTAFFSIHLGTLVIGILSVLAIVGLKKISKKIPSGLIVVTVMLFLSYLFDFKSLGISVIGNIPSGLPPMSLPSLPFEQIKELFPIALTLALIAFMEAIAVSKSFEEEQSEYEIDPNQELIALGTANILGAFFSAYPTTGGFSRTAVNVEAGAKSNISAIVSVLIIAATLLFLTPLFYYLPKAVLAAIVLVAVSNLVDLNYPKRLYKKRKDEFYLLVFTFFMTLVLGVKEGILLGVLVSVFLLIYRTSKPHIAVLGNVKGSDYYKNIFRFEKDVIDRDDLVIIRFDAQLYFGNKDYLKRELLKLVSKKAATLKAVILNAESISYIDSSANMMLLKLVTKLKKRNIAFIITGAIGPTRDILYSGGMVDIIGMENLFIRTSEAVCYFDSKCIPSVIQQRITQQKEV